MNGRKRLRQLVEAPELLVLPGAYDALSARILQQAGFHGVYLTGYGQSASCLGAPDVGLMTLTEMADRAARTAEALTVPLVCDGDTGFGGGVNVARTVRAYERSGAAAIQLEDQTFPKRCGHMTGRRVIPAEEMARTLQASGSTEDCRERMLTFADFNDLVDLPAVRRIEAGDLRALNAPTQA